MPATKSEMDEIRAAAAVARTNPRALDERARKIKAERCTIPPERLFIRFEN